MELAAAAALALLPNLASPAEHLSMGHTQHMTAKDGGRMGVGGGARGVGPPEAIITNDLTFSGRIRVRAVPMAAP